MIRYINRQNYLVLVICFQLVLISCGTKPRSDYKTIITYFENDYKPSKDLRDGRVALDFGGLYQEDSLKVKVNDKPFLKTLISTSEKTGKALLIELDSVSKIDHFSIQVNNGEVVTISCDQNNQLFTVDYINDSLKINSVSYFIPGR